MTANLRAVPDRPRRGLGLIRVSKERDGMIAPEVQKAAITGYAASRGIEITGWIEGLDESGSSRRSAWWARLEEAVSQVETGGVDVLVVWKYSRAARHRLKWATAVDRVETAGGSIESATEQVDVSTSTGRFTRGMLAELQAFEAERIGEVWQEVHARRVRNGLPPTGKPKWGYTYDKAEKLHKPDPVTGPVLTDLYRRYVAGESMYALARWLNTHGHHTLSGGPWSDRTLRRVMDSGFAAGRFAFQGELHAGVHEPLIDAGLWQAYQDARGARRVVPARIERSQYLLSGLVRCARCGGAMAANVVDPGTKLSQRAKGRAEGKRYSAGKPRLTFRCRNGRETGRCPGMYISMRLAEEHILGYLRELAAQVDERAETKVVADTRRTLLEVEEARLAREATKIDQALTQLALRDATDPMPRATYLAAKAQLEERAAELAGAHELAGRTRRRGASDAPAQAAKLLADWHKLPVAARREVLRGLIDCVLVRPGRQGDGAGRYMRVVEWDEIRP